MDFGTNKTPVEIIKEGAFGGTYFRDLYLVLMINFIKTHGNNLMFYKILIKSIIVQIIMMLVLINVVLNVAHH